ncbi:MAG TPA: hypothetical protein VFL85_04080 [Candidatus Saccharimonadales bacterium]|nr:hypothetical protein [Candidatus Saccharimonadales bacterium]
MGSSPSNHYIELNGKRYNALTGEMIARTKPSAAQGKVIDGFVKAKPAAAKPTPTAHVVKPVVPVAKPAAQPVKAVRTMSDISRSPARHAVRRPQEHSKTLMRKSVKKPAPSLKRSVKTHTRTDILAKVPEHAIVPKHSIQTIDERRLKHAHQVAKSELISRFGHIQLPEPASRPVETHAPATAAIKQVIKTTPQKDIKPVYASTAAAMPGTKAQPSLDIFEQALAHANSHKQTYAAPKKSLKHRTKKRSLGRKLATTGAVGLAVLLLGGFIAYQNTANIEMRLASSKAGIHAALPGYKPAGFTASNFMYDTGAVAVNFHNNKDGRTYKVVQKTSNWNSDTLANEYVASVAGSNYHTTDAGGRTIFTYGNNNATWVDGGIWYTVTSDGALSSSQLLDLARSM